MRGFQCARVIGFVSNVVGICLVFLGGCLLTVDIYPTNNQNCGAINSVQITGIDLFSLPENTNPELVMSYAETSR